MEMTDLQKIDELLTFRPQLKTVLWGGSRIARYKDIPDAPASVGESWEISALPGHVSVVDGGSFDGTPLDELARRFGPALLGSRVCATTGSDFPLLIKIIDANRNLSVQVHPGADMARASHGEPNGKSEMWYVIDSVPDAEIICGLAGPLTPEAFDRHVAEGTILSAVRIHKSRPGQFYYIPAGTIHSAGAGNLIAEVQQTSDVTYRVFDYDRLDADGRPRPLHTDKAREAIDYSWPVAIRPMGEIFDRATGGAVQSPFFNIDYLTPDSFPREYKSDGSTFTILMVTAGTLQVSIPSGTHTYAAGSTILIPASITDYTLAGDATLLRITP